MSSLKYKVKLKYYDNVVLIGLGESNVFPVTGYAATVAVIKDGK